MKKLALAFFACAFYLQANATHLLGGELFYDKLSTPGQFKITLILYRDGGGAPFGNTQSISTTIPGLQTKTLTLVSSDTLVTYGSCIYPVVEGYRYEGVISNVPTIPVGGFIFKWSSCCRPFVIQNLQNAGGQGFYVSANMLPGSENSPRFLAPASIAGTANIGQYFNHSAYDPDPQDSIYVTFINAKEGGVNSPVNLSYNQGYSKDFPFGTNAVTSLDPHSGLLYVDSVAQGAYAVALRVRSYTNGVLTSVVRRDVPFYFDPMGHHPTLTLSNVTGATSVTSLNNSYVIRMKEMDSLKFDLTGITNQVVGGSLSNVTVLGYGALLDTNSMYYGNCVGNNCATYSSATGALSGVGIVNTHFEFSPDTSFIPSGISESNQITSFTAFVQDSCGVGRSTSLVVHIIVEPVGAIYGGGTLNSCYGIGVYPTVFGDTSDITWSPAAGVSNVNAGMPLLNPSSSTLYTATHNISGEAVQFMVNVDSIGPLSFNLINTGAELVVSGYGNSQVNWYYNGALLPVSNDTLNLDVTGTYWAEVVSSHCTAFSDTVHATVSAKMSNSNNQGGTINAMASGGSFQFSLSQNGNILDNLEIILPDTSAGKTTSLVVVELLQAGVSLKSAVATKQNDWLWEASGLNTLISPGMLYEVKISTDLPQMVLFQPSVMPFTEDNGIVNIASGYYLENGVQVQGAYPFVNFEFSSALGVHENEIAVNVYPNPASDILNVELSVPGSMLLYDAHGRLIMKQGLATMNRLDVSQLTSGIYIYEIQTDNGVAIGKVNIQ